MSNDDGDGIVVKAWPSGGTLDEFARPTRST